MRDIGIRNVYMCVFGVLVNVSPVLAMRIVYTALGTMYILYKYIRGERVGTERKTTKRRNSTHSLQNRHYTLAQTIWERVSENMRC